MRTRGWGVRGRSHAVAAAAAVLLTCFALLTAGAVDERQTPEASLATARAEETADRSAIEKALDEPLSLELTESPLSDAVAFFAQKLGIDIRLDRRSLEAVAIHTDIPITFQVRDISAGAALRLLLRDLDLTYVERDRVLLITTPEEANSVGVAKVYDVAELVYPFEEEGAVDEEEAEPDYDQLIELISTTVAPTTWGEGTGPGNIASLSVPGRRLLIFSQIQEVHCQVASLLAALKAVRHPGAFGICSANKSGGLSGEPAGGPRAGEGGPKAAQSPGHVRPFAPIVVGRSKREQAIQEALKLPVDLDVTEEPLIEVMQRLEKQISQSILLDRRALGAVAIASDTPVTFRAKSMPLKSALNLMLRDLDLTWAIRDEVLLITTSEEADAILPTVVYDVSDLADRSGYIDFDALIDAISLSIEPERWDTAGGPGSIREIETKGVRALVASQTERVHDEIQMLLEKIRSAPRHPRAERPVARPPFLQQDGMGQGGGGEGIGGGGFY